MRPAGLVHAQSWRRRLLLRLIGVLQGETPEILRLLFHRPEYFGRPFTALVDEVMRRPSRWSVVEREMLATRVSQINECPFCETSHQTIAQLADPRRDVAAGVHGVGVDARFAAVLPFAEKLTREPDAVTSKDLRMLLSAGVSRADIDDAIHVVFIFCCINRIANALDFEVLGPRARIRSGRRLLSQGYGI